MHFNASAASVGDAAVLESRLLYPKRGYQCLQFFYYHSAGANAALRIHVREYDEANPDGKVRLVKIIEGDYEFCNRSSSNVNAFTFSVKTRPRLQQDPLRSSGNCTT